MSRLALVIKGAVLALALLLGYRLFQTVTRPEVLLKLGHLVFLGGLVTWTGLNTWQVFAAAGNHASPGRREASELTRVSLLISTAFLLACTAFYLRGKTRGPAGVLIPYESLALQAGLILAVFLAAVWAGHAFLCRKAPRRDPGLYPMACFLAGAGLVLLFRLGPDLFDIRNQVLFSRLAGLQIRSLGISLILFAVCVYYFGEKRLESLTRKRYIYGIVSIALITLTALVGKEVNGRKLFLDLGVMNFQTVELVKVFALLFMTGYFRYEMAFIESGKNLLNIPRMRYLMPYLVMWVLILLPIFLQKDLGPTALIFLLFIAVFYLGTGSWVSVTAGFIAMAGAGTAAYVSGFPSMVRTRVDMWLDPFHYSQNMAEALWAVSGGGWFGRGTGLGLSHRIPVVQSDFNVAALAEEWGFIGLFCVFWTLCLLGGRVVILASRSRRPYLQMFITGFALLWIFQTLIIACGNTGLLPLTGITFPFVSYGGSSLLINFLILGVVVRFSHDLAPVGPAPGVNRGHHTDPGAGLILNSTLERSLA